MEQKNIPEIDRNTAKSLFELARAASDKAYAPFSHYKVGAALLTKGGKVYTGVNIENSSFGATICAERTAFVKAISEGERKFEASAIYGSRRKNRRRHVMRSAAFTPITAMMNFRKICR